MVAATPSAAQYRLRAHQVMIFFVPAHCGHDDVLNAAFLEQAQLLTHLRAAVGRST